MRFRYSLKSLFLLIALVCYALAIRQHAAHQSASGIEQVRSHGGSILAPEAPTWKWLLLGDQYNGDIVATFAGGSLDDDVIDTLTQLRGLRIVFCQYTEVTNEARERMRRELPHVKLVELGQPSYWEYVRG
jgi:hypothetical protein